jgi:hypothetical protein
MKRESIKLTSTQWLALTKLAAKTKSVATTTTDRRPSWRAMVRRLADGELRISKLNEHANTGRGKAAART